ncbi:diacylglycerol/lipid kinase family protein [Weissella koreensis]|nr:YegS/Rv2252/BmrU family lipid kinase [Weissella koreensis]
MYENTQAEYLKLGTVRFMENKYQFIINPVAKSGKSVENWELLKDELISESIDFDFYISKDQHDLERWIKRFLKRQEEQSIQLVIMGGDGTLNLTINAILERNSEYHQPIAYIPDGSGNDFARAHGISVDPMASLQRILKKTKQNIEKPLTIDLGIYENIKDHKRKYFVNNLGVGFDAMVVSMTNHSLAKVWLNKMGWGSLAYPLLILKVLTEQDSFAVTVKGEGRLADFYENAYLMTVSNHPYFGGGVKIMPDADPHDGKLDLIIIEKPKNKIRLLKIVKALLKNKLYDQPEVHRYTNKKLEFQTHRLELAQADGEELGAHIYNYRFTSKTLDFWL